jgi:hypothetical protein
VDARKVFLVLFVTTTRKPTIRCRRLRGGTGNDVVLVLVVDKIFGVLGAHVVVELGGVMKGKER